MIFVIWTLLLCGGNAARLIDDSGLSWKDLEVIHDKELFNRNLVKNPSGQNGLNRWMAINVKQTKWTTESLPNGGLPLPDELVNTTSYFVSPASDDYSLIRQDIDLIKKGFTEKFSDHYQPSIEVSAWFNSPISIDQSYVLKLYGSNERGDPSSHVRKSVAATPEYEPNKWHKLQFVIKAYNGTGLRSVVISHTTNLPYPHRLKIAGTSVIFKWREISSPAFILSKL